MTDRLADLVIAENERLDDLECGQLFLLQRKDKYCFNLDSVLLANLVDRPENKVIADLGSGSGVIAVLLAGKRKARRVYAVELQRFMLELLKKNVYINGLENAIEIVEGRMQDNIDIIGKNSCDIVVCNPPYSKVCRGMESTDAEMAVCRHEIEVTLPEVIACSAALLKPKGSAYFIYKTARLGEVFDAVSANGMAVKKLYFITPAPGKAIDTFIAKVVKGANQGLSIDMINVYDEHRELTDRVAKLYGKK